ncbi:MAG: LicD family protein [Clostridia bacterium]|nr:LicD family protein [Clostridia bacterium]
MRDVTAGGNLHDHQSAMTVILREFDRVCRALDIPYVLFAGTLLGAVRHGGFIPWDDDLDVMMHRDDYERFLREAESIIDTDRFFLQKEFSEHWPMFFSKLRLNKTACLEKFHPRDKAMHQGIYIDVFPCDNAYDGQLLRKLQFYASKVVIAKSLLLRGYDTDSRKKKLFISLCRVLPMAPFLWLTKGKKKRGGTVHSFLGGASKYSKNVYPESYFSQRTTVCFEGGEYPASREYSELLRQLYGEDYMTLPTEEERRVKQHAILVDTENSYENYSDYRDGMTFDVYTRSIR